MGGSSWPKDSISWVLKLVVCLKRRRMTLKTWAYLPQDPRLQRISFELCKGQKAKPSITDKQRKAFIEKRKIEDKKWQKSRNTYKD